MCIIVILYLILMNTYGVHSKCQALREKVMKFRPDFNSLMAQMEMENYIFTLFESILEQKYWNK